MLKKVIRFLRHSRDSLNPWYWYCPSWYCPTEVFPFVFMTFENVSNSSRYSLLECNPMTLLVMRFMLLHLSSWNGMKQRMKMCRDGMILLTNVCPVQVTLPFSSESQSELAYLQEVWPVILLPHETSSPPSQWPPALLVATWQTTWKQEQKCTRTEQKSCSSSTRTRLFTPRRPRRRSTRRPSTSRTFWAEARPHPARWRPRRRYRPRTRPSPVWFRLTGPRSTSPRRSTRFCPSTRSRPPTRPSTRSSAPWETSRTRWSVTTRSVRSHSSLCESAKVCALQIL